MNASNDVPSETSDGGPPQAMEWLSLDIESVILELQTRLEQNNMILKPDFRQSIPRSAMITQIKNMQSETEKALKTKECTNLVLTTESADEPSTSNTVSQSGSSDRMKLAPESCKRVSFILGKIHRLMLTNNTVTRRDLYYQNVRLFKSQSSVDRTVDRICRILSTPQWNLGIYSTSKGLVYGPLRIALRSGETVDCSLQQGGTLIPQDLPHGASYETSAKFGLVLEKDTAFQNLLSSGLGYPLNCSILITGKGYPDMNTRFLVKDLSTKLSIPIFALVDGDPHGIDIFFNYKYGSMKKAYMNDQLCAFHIMWLGIHPTDMADFEPSILQPLTTADSNKIRSLLERSYVKNEEKLREQIESLAQRERKCEIEDITTISNRFLNDVYLPTKISMRKFI